MTFFHFILIGFFSSFLGSIPFGPVNLSMVDTTLNRGFKNGLNFATAASLIEILQATAALYLGIKMTEYLVFTNIWHLVFIVFMLSLGLYFLFKRRKANPTIQTGGFKSFLRGGIIAALNPQAIPYYLIIFTWIQINPGDGIQWSWASWFLAGISLGKFAALYLFSRFSSWLKNHTLKIIPLMNRFIGSVLIFLACLNFVKDFLW